MAESIAHFAVKSIGLSRLNGRKPCTLMEAARHNLREIQAELGARGHIDPTQTYRNSILRGPASAVEVQDLARALLSAHTIDTESMRRDHCQAIEAVFSLPPESSVSDDAAYFQKCLAWAENALKLPVLSAVVHCDEAANHLHVLLLPIKNGEHAGSKPIDRAALKRLREAFFTNVAGPAGLKRTGAKLRGHAKTWAINAVLHKCNALGLPNRHARLWRVFEDAIKRDPTPALEALGIDVNSIRPSGTASPIDHTSNPLGFEPNPLGFSTSDVKIQSLSCVGIHSKPHQTIITTLSELWGVLGRHSQNRQRKMQGSARVHQARMAQSRAIEQPTPQDLAELVPSIVWADDDGVIRIRDEYAHDTSAWND